MEALECGFHIVLGGGVGAQGWTAVNCQALSHPRCLGPLQPGMRACRFVDGRVDLIGGEVGDAVGDTLSGCMTDSNEQVVTPTSNGEWHLTEKLVALVL